MFRAFAGEYDREFIEARIAEIRTLLDSADRLGNGAEVPEITSIEGYNNRSVDYDERDNSLLSHKTIEPALQRKYWAHWILSMLHGVIPSGSPDWIELFLSLGESRLGVT